MKIYLLIILSLNLYALSPDSIRELKQHSTLSGLGVLSEQATHAWQLLEEESSHESAAFTYYKYAHEQADTAATNELISLKQNLQNYLKTVDVKELRALSKTDFNLNEDHIHPLIIQMLFETINAAVFIQRKDTHVFHSIKKETQMRLNAFQYYRLFHDQVQNEESLENTAFGLIDDYIKARYILVMTHFEDCSLYGIDFPMTYTQNHQGLVTSYLNSVSCGLKARESDTVAHNIFEQYNYELENTTLPFIQSHEFYLLQDDARANEYSYKETASRAIWVTRRFGVDF